MNPPPASRRWWNRPIGRVGTRLMMLVLGGGLGWFIHLARIQRDAVAAIRAAGGDVRYDWGWVDGHSAPPGHTLRWPSELVALLGSEYFTHVSVVFFPDGRASQVDDALMARVGQLGQLEHLDLQGCESVTDAGLAQLRGLTSLRELTLHSTRVTGAGLRHLAGLTRLVFLSLPNIPMTDADLAHLKGMTGLDEIVLNQPSPGVTDAGLAHLAGLVNLRVLRIDSARVTSRGLASLRGKTRLASLGFPRSAVEDLSPIQHLTSLRLLDLDHTPLDDAGLGTVARLGRIEFLGLEGTRVTDAGLAHLRGLGQLNHLRLGHTGVTDAGLASIGGLPKLNQLTLDHTKVGDAGLAGLAGLDMLTSLDLDGTRVTDAGLSEMVGLKSCVTIAVDRMAISDEGIKAARLKRPRTNFVRPGR